MKKYVRPDLAESKFLCYGTAKDTYSELFNKEIIIAPVNNNIISNGGESHLKVE